jgi:hypothetical protein
MPLTSKGKKIKAAMAKEYSQSGDGKKKKGEQIFYATENKGTIKGVTKSKKRKSK